MAARDRSTQSRPLVTFAVFSYNQEPFIRQAVRAALDQTYARLQIVLSDDSSSDGTFDAMRQMAAEYRGDHQITLNRNDKNLGIGGHIRKLAELAKGEVIVIAAGDDISFPERTSR